MESLKRDPLLRTLFVILVAVLAFGLLYPLLIGSTGTVGYGSHLGMGQQYGMGQHYGMSGQVSSGSGFSLAALLGLIIKILFVLLIIGLVVGVIKAIKPEVLPAVNFSTGTGFVCASPEQAKTSEVKEVCAGCGKELQGEWKVCPYCAKER